LRAVEFVGIQSHLFHHFLLFSLHPVYQQSREDIPYKNGKSQPDENDDQDEFQKTFHNLCVPVPGEIILLNY
jgi:hypothetical protein